MSDLATYLEESVIDWVFDEAAMDSPPTDLYLAAHTGPPGNDGEGNEVEMADYDRAETGPGEWDRIAGNGPTEAENNVDIQFGVAQNDWGNITHVSLWTTPDGTGECLFQTQMDEAVPINEGDEFIVRAGLGTWGLD